MKGLHEEVLDETFTFRKERRMKAGRLRNVLAKAMQVDPSVIQTTMRNIREGGFLTTGAHGVNAPNLTYLDAARVLIAQIIELAPGRRAPRHISEIGSLPWADPAFAWSGDPFTLDEILPSSKSNTFEHATATLIQVFAECRGSRAFKDASRPVRDGSVLKPECRIEIFMEDNAASIVMSGAHYSFHAPPKGFRDIDKVNDDERYRLGRQAICFVNQEVVACVADGFAECS